MSMIEEYLSLTGRPAATLTVDEFVTLKKNDTVPVMPSFVSQAVPIKSSVEEFKEDKEEPVLKKASPAKASTPKLINPAKKEKEDPKESALSLLRSVNG